MENVIPLKERPVDILILGFYFLNILFITYIIDIEQIMIADVTDFEYPIWPPVFIVDLVHWWGNTYDPLLMARPMFWQMEIWLDQIFFGPYYVVAIYAFIKGKNWIRIPSIIYGTMLFTNVFIILGEEIWGVHATGSVPMVLFANAAWFLMPILVIARMWMNEKPFTRN